MFLVFSQEEKASFWLCDLGLAVDSQSWTGEAAHTKQSSLNHNEGKHVVNQTLFILLCLLIMSISVFSWLLDVSRLMLFATLTFEVFYCPETFLRLVDWSRKVFGV